MDEQTKNEAVTNKTARKAPYIIAVAILLLLAIAISITVTLVNNHKTNSVGTGACEFFETRNTSDRDIKYVKMTVKKFGTIIILLDATTAPITVTNFLELVNSGFYDGLTFHRIMANFMIQGGDPNGDGTGGSEKNIKGEFLANGYWNDISHVRGVISMARSPYSYDSASSQFFICNADAQRSLDYQYAAFGYVIAGMSVVDKITEKSLPYTSAENANTIMKKRRQPVIKSIVEITEEEALGYVHAN